MAATRYPERLIGTFTQDLNFGGFKGVNAAEPTAAADLATKQYVDNVAQGVAAKAEVRLATTAALAANTYANGTAGVGATLTANANGAIAAIDGTSPSANDRLLVKNEAATANNGVYVVTQVGSGGTPYILTRATDMDDATSESGAQEYAGAFVYVQAGSTNGGTAWICNIAPNPTVGTTAITFVQFGAVTSYSAGNGISISSFTITAVAAANSGVQVTGGGIGLLLNGATLNLSSSGVKVSDGGIAATQLAASAFPAGSGLTGGGGSTVSVQSATRETPSGTINGSNVTFTLANTPKAGSEEGHLGGILLNAGGGNDYTISGATITMATAPLTTDGPFLWSYLY